MGCTHIPVCRVPAMGLDKRKALNIVFNRATNDGDICQTPEKAKRILETLNLNELAKNTGETLSRIKNRHSKELNLIGYDNSEAMIEQAKLKNIDITFVDLEKNFELPEFSYGVILYTLQFLQPNAR